MYYYLRPSPTFLSLSPPFVASSLPPSISVPEATLDPGVTLDSASMSPGKSYICNGKRALTLLAIDPVALQLHSVYSAGLLTVDNLYEVYSKVYPQMLKWRPMGLCLKLPHFILANIEDQYRDNAKCLEKMLLAWLRKGQDTTWQALIDALRELIVGEEGAAEDLEEYLKSKSARG